MIVQIVYLCIVEGDAVPYVAIFHNSIVIEVIKEAGKLCPT